MAGQRGNGQMFNMKLSEWAARFEGNMDALARQSSQEIAENVVADTPLDIGFLRGSWQPSIGEPAVRSSVFLGNGGAQVDVGAVVASMRAGDLFHMTNNAKYAMRLEFGFVGEDSLGRYYNQAGRYFVTRNVKRWPAVVTKLMQELK